MSILHYKSIDEVAKYFSDKGKSLDENLIRKFKVEEREVKLDYLLDNVPISTDYRITDYVLAHLEVKLNGTIFWQGYLKEYLK